MKDSKVRCQSPADIELFKEEEKMSCHDFLGIQGFLGIAFFLRFLKFLEILEFIESLVSINSKISRNSKNSGGFELLYIKVTRKEHTSLSAE